MKKLFLLSFILFSLFSIEPAMAAPGGNIASALFDTNIGKILYLFLFILFLPFIIYASIVEGRAKHRSNKDLKYMTKYSSIFEWLIIRERIKECFYSIHSGWNKEGLASISNIMTEWYWQNQQKVYLDRWHKEGLVNICNVKKISNISPLFFMHNNSGAEHEGSVLAISITAKMQDYLKNKNSGKIIEGSKRYKEVESIWVFTLVDRKWKVSDIEEGSMSLVYAGLVKELTPIEETIETFRYQHIE